MAKKAPKPEGPELSSLSLPVTQEHRQAALLREENQEDVQAVIRILVADIYASPTNPRKHFDNQKIAQLGASMAKNGQIHPITVRPKKGMAGKHELICGECRWLAKKLIGHLFVNAIVNDVSDEVVQDLQFTENLERQDVHPMDEAVTFRAMIDTGRYTIPDIAAKFLKSEDFVAQRLSLNNLIAEFQTDFWEGKFLIGHAVLFSRLPDADQKGLYKEYGGRNHYETIRETRDYIDRNIIRKLSAAPFKKDDAELVPAAGACESCLKRSGCNTSLFADYSEDDRCFDQACFQKKLDAFLINKVKVTVENNPEILLMDSLSWGEKTNPAVKKIADSMKIKILENSYGNDISSNKSTGSVPVKVLMVSGSEAGKVKTMYKESGSKGKGSSAGSGKATKRTALHVQDEIDGIKERQKRALELDREKIWEKTKGMIEKPSQLKKLGFDSIVVTQEELRAIATAVLMEIPSGEYRDAAAKVAGIRGEFYYPDVEQAKNIKTVTIPQIWHLLRLLMLGTLKNSGHPDKSAGPFMLMPVLRLPFYLGEKYISIEAEQNAEATKRIERAEKRIQDLKAEKKELEGKPGKGTKKADPKKGGAKAVPTPSDFEKDDQEDDE